MTNRPASLPHEKDLLLATLDLPTLERDAYLVKACQGNSELRARVERLLKNVGDGDGFMSVPAVDLTATTPFDSVQPGLQVDRYRLMEQIGEGGMGVVYVAEQIEPVRRMVALKVIKPGMDTKAVIARFEAERQALALMDHPNIACVLDAGTTAERLPFFVMELVRGMPITEYCDQTQSSTTQRLQLFIDVCNAVQHAHQKGIIHRDLKPSNILVTLHDSKPVVKVIDFGVAKALHQPLSPQTIYTALHQVVGTPLYMSPEQLELSGLDIDTRSDVYALGVLLYELIAGSTPFEHERLVNSGFDELRRIIREEDPPRPSIRVTTLPKVQLSTLAEKRGLGQREFSREIRSELDWITLKALAKDRAHRYGSAADFAADVQRYLEDAPVDACPPSWWYSTRKLMKRHRGFLMAGLLLIVALVLGTAISLRQAIRATHAERESQIRLEAIRIEQSKTRDALIAVQAVESEQRRLRTAAEVSAKEAERAALQQQQLREQAEEATRRSQWELYVANLTPMQSALKDKHYGRLEELLKNSKPAVGEPDFRGWEWFYMQQRVESASRTLPPADGTLSKDLVDFHPSRNEFATFTPPFHIDIWDASSLNRIRRLNCPAPIKRMAWSPNGDRIAIGTYGKNELIVLNSSDGQIVWHSQPLLNRHGVASGMWIGGLSWHHDGERIAVGSRFGDVAVVNLETKSTTIVHARDEEGYLADLAWHPRDNILTVGARYGERLMIDTAAGTSTTLKLHNSEIGYAVAWSKSGELLATSEDSRIRVADRAGNDICILAGHKSMVEDLLWIDDRHLASASRDHSVRIWNLDSKTQIDQLQLFDEPVKTLDVSPEGSLLVLASSTRVKIAHRFSGRGASQVYIPDEKGQSVASVPDHNKTNYLQWSPDGAELHATGHISWVGDRGVIVNPISLRLVSSVLRRSATHLSQLSDPQIVLRAGLGDILRAEDARTGVAIQTIPCPLFGHAYAIWSPSARHVMTYNDKNRPLLRDGTTGELVHQWPPDIRSGMLTGAWDSSETKFLAPGYGFPVLLRVGGTSTKIPDGESHNSFGVAWHPSGCIVAVGNFRGEIWLRDGNTMAVVALLRGHFGEVDGLHFSPDGRRLASASRDGTVRIWDVATGRELLQLTAPRIKGFTRVSWSPDGTQLAAGTNERHVLVFGEVGMPLVPIDAALPAHGAVYQYFNSLNASDSFGRVVPLASWRQPLQTLLERLASLKENDQAEVGRVTGEWLQESLISQEAFEAYVVAAFCLIDGHEVKTTAVTVGEVLLQFLSQNPSILAEELTLECELEARYRICHRLAESTIASEFSQQLKAAREMASHLVDKFPRNATGWKRQISLVALEVDFAIRSYVEQFALTERSSNGEHFEELFHSYASVLKQTPVDVLPFQVPAESTQAIQEWITTITNNELQAGIAPTYGRQWIATLEDSVRDQATNHYTYYLLALGQLWTNDESAYQTTCRRMIPQFAQTQNPLEARFTAWTACLAPGAISDYSQLLELYERLHVGNAIGVELGAILYRMGEYQRAREALAQVAEKEQPDSFPAYPWFYLAMVEAKLGNADSARQWLERATGSATEQLELGRRDDAILWNRLATIRLLQREANQAIGTMADER